MSGHSLLGMVRGILAWKACRLVAVAVEECTSVVAVAYTLVGMGACNTVGEGAEACKLAGEGVAELGYNKTWYTVVRRIWSRDRDTFLVGEEGVCSSLEYNVGNTGMGCDRAADTPEEKKGTYILLNTFFIPAVKITFDGYESRKLQR